MLNSTEHTLAQADIERLSCWEKDWLLGFNENDGKCKEPDHVGSKNHRHEYFMNVGQLPQVETEKYLGVYTNDVLNRNIHIEKKYVHDAKRVHCTIPY